MSIPTKSLRESRPYWFNPIDPDETPEWFDKTAEYYLCHCTLSYFRAVEQYLVGESDDKLAEILAEAETDPETLSCFVPVDLIVDVDVLTHMLAGEIAYRQEVKSKQ